MVCSSRTMVVIVGLSSDLAHSSSGFRRCRSGCTGGARKGRVFAQSGRKCKRAVRGLSPILRAVDPNIAVEKRYRFEACVSRGAFGEVWRGADRETGEPVAIKRLHEHLRNDENTGRLAREA